MLSFLLLACLPKPDPPRAVPVLPATSAPLYTRAPGTSPDLAVAGLAADLPWDETLSGAAGALALAHSKNPRLEGHEVQWAAYRAGWPHPLLSFGIEQVAEGEIAYIVWTAGDLAPLGTDTFVIRDGKIVVQTFAAHVPAAA